MNIDLNDIVVCYWADGSWCFPDELFSTSWKSDDYAVLRVSPDYDEGSADYYVVDAAIAAALK